MVSLSPNERVLLKDEAKYHGTRGTLYLTNKKISFDYEKRGIVFKGKYSAVNLLFDRISEVSVIGVGPFKKLAINTVRNQSSFGVPRYEFNVNNPQNWKTEIEVARRTQVAVPQREVKEIIKEIVKIKCPYCGMLVESTLARCPNCSGIIR
ncbi:MAG: hypothetical protein OEZ35_03440 [Candidatus Bathyarchaeota archaeon]|nr:hypothetical protein [Candidatus Bathyarchaeota archaeon]